MQGRLFLDEDFCKPAFVHKGVEKGSEDEIRMIQSAATFCILN